MATDAENQRAFEKLCKDHESGVKPWSYRGRENRDAWQILRDAEAAAQNGSWDEPIKLPNGAVRTARTILGYVDHNVNAGFASLSAQLKGVVGALAAVAAGEKFDEAKLLAGVEEAAYQGILRAERELDGGGVK